MKPKNNHIGKVFRLTDIASWILFEKGNDNFIDINTVILFLKFPTKPRNDLPADFVKILVLTGKHHGKIGFQLYSYFEKNYYKEVVLLNEGDKTK